MNLNKNNDEYLFLVLSSIRSFDDLVEEDLKQLESIQIDRDAYEYKSKKRIE